MALKLVTAPQGYPISLTEAKAHLRVEVDDENALIESLIAAATGSLDGGSGILGRCLLPQVWRWTTSFPEGSVLRVPLPPLISVGSIAYVDSAAADQTIDSEDYTVDTDSGEITITGTWPQGTSVKVTFTAGYQGQELDSPAGPNAVPEPIKQAIKLLIGAWYAHREAVTAQSANELPMAVQWLINPYRTFFFA